MANLILCIDDQPIRYKRLNPPGAVIVVTCRLEDVNFYIDRHKASIDKIKGVMLDHDMPFLSGQVFARIIREEIHVPVALTSNNASGRKAMRDILEEYEVPVIDADCSWPSWDKIALDFIHKGV